MKACQPESKPCLECYLNIITSLRMQAHEEYKYLPHRYIFALYWAITTLATVGYGDLSAANPAEAVWATIYMFFNLALGAYVLGTITLIVIKHDERTGRYRDLITHLKDYIRVNEIPPVSPHLWPACNTLPTSLVAGAEPKHCCAPRQTS